MSAAMDAFKQWAKDKTISDIQNYSRVDAFVAGFEAGEASARDALEDLVFQFANAFARDGKRYVSTMGLSALEGAFEVLGWQDPHECTAETVGCDWPGCAEHTTNGMPTDDGYKRYCSPHGVRKMAEAALGGVSGSREADLAEHPANAESGRSVQIQVGE